MSAGLFGDFRSWPVRLPISERFAAARKLTEWRGQLPPLRESGLRSTAPKVQKAWLDLEGQIMSATALLDAIPRPDDADIDAAMAGNICRCGTYVRIRQAIKNAAAEA